LCGFFHPILPVETFRLKAIATALPCGASAATQRGNITPSGKNCSDVFSAYGGFYDLFAME
jgi:hypothetical protein